MSLEKKNFKDLEFINEDLLGLKTWRIIPNEEGYSCLSGQKIHFSEKEERMDIIYLEMAKSWSKNSYSKRAQVGCLIVRNKSIISDGYNGSPTGFPNQCEDESNKTLSWVLHAEANAITKLAKSTQTSEGSTLYVTLSPCFECSKLIIQSGIKRVVFTELYRNTDSIPFLLKGGIEVVKI
jgi:dCMP deaminase